MERIELSEVAQSLDDIIHLVAGSRHRVVVEDDGKPCGAFVSISDLELLDHLAHDPKHETRIKDMEALRKAAVARTAFPAGGRVRLTEDGKDSVGLVPAKDVDTLEMLDARLQMEAARRMLEDEMKRAGD